MNLSIIISGLKLISDIGESQNNKKLVEAVIKVLQSNVDQINSILTNQNAQISKILTQFETTQYILIATMVLLVICLSLAFYSLWKRVKLLESKIN